MLIAIDIDEVLADTLNSFIAKYNKTYKTSLYREQFTSYDWWEVLDLSLEEFSRRYLKFNRQGFFDNLPVTQGSQAAVKKLAAAHNLAAVTSRPRSLVHPTTVWLKKNFGDALPRVYYTRNIPFGPEFESKYHICRRLSADALIEDNFDYAEDCADNGMQVFLFDAPWNQGIKDGPNIKRVRSWPEITEILSDGD